MRHCISVGPKRLVTTVVSAVARIVILSRLLSCPLLSFSRFPLFVKDKAFTGHPIKFSPQQTLFVYCVSIYYWRCISKIISEWKLYQLNHNLILLTITTEKVTIKISISWF